MRLRSLLFVPADRPDRYSKAFASGADMVCLDLEDAVAPSAKDEARRHALDALANETIDAARVVFRLNDGNTDVGQQDVQSLCDLGRTPAALILPKVRKPEEIRRAQAVLAGRQLGPRFIALMETAEGLERAAEIALATNGALLFGGADLSAELGCALDWEPLLYARSRVVHAAATAGIVAIDMPLLIVGDADRLEHECVRARALGFIGKAAIHPTQIAAINTSFTPSSSEIERARAVVSAAEASNGGVTVVNGRMIDAAIVRAARHTLSLAGESVT
jgi:citrate lyase beta subunit